MKVFHVLILTLVVALLDVGSVQSFQLASPSASFGDGGLALSPSAASATKLAKSAPRILSSPVVLHSVADSDGEGGGEDELAKIELQIAELNESLEQAKTRLEKAEENVDQLQEEKAAVVSETETIIDRLKRMFSDEVTELSDRIESAQDSMRNAFIDTRSKISSVQAEAKERQGQLKKEISDLESRLASLRQEASSAARERDRVRKSIEEESRAVRRDSRRELDEARSAAAREKKELAREKLELEERIRTASENAIPSAAELEEEKKVALPAIASLKDALSEMKKMVAPRVEEMKEKRAAMEMFFDQSMKGTKKDKKSELNFAKSAFEAEMSAEDAKLVNVTEFYDRLLERKGKELERSLELAKEPVESLGAEPIAEAKRKMIDLNKEKLEAISRQKEARVDALRKMAESHEAIKDQYDAEYENELWNLKQQSFSAQSRLEEADKRREIRKEQLGFQLEELTRKLSTLMQEERVKAEKEYQVLTTTKAAELTKLESQKTRTMEEIKTLELKVAYVRSEMDMLDGTYKRNQRVLSELEGERASFRRQMRRTVAVAMGKITRGRIGVK